MTPELKQLREIFEDRPVEELEAILSRHDNDVAAAVEAIFEGEMERSSVSGGKELDLTVEDEGPHRQRKAWGVRRKSPHCQQMNNAMDESTKGEGDFQHTKECGNIEIVMAAEASSFEVVGHEEEKKKKSRHYIYKEPQQNQRRNRHGVMREGDSESPDTLNEDGIDTQQHQNENDKEKLGGQEEKASEVSPEASMAPSDRVVCSVEVESMSDEELSKLLKSPVFLQRVDDNLDTQMEVEVGKQFKHQGVQLRGRSSDTASLSSSGSDIESKEHESKIVNGLKISGSTSSFVKARLKLIGRGFMNQVEEAREAVQLVEKLEAMNKANEIEQSKLEAKKKASIRAEDAQLNSLRDELHRFLLDHPVGTYEQWINETNAEIFDCSCGKGNDFGFFTEDSCHRKVWNESARKRGLSARSFVRARTCDVGTPLCGTKIDRPELKREKGTHSVVLGHPEALQKTPSQKQWGTNDDEYEYDKVEYGYA